MGTIHVLSDLLANQIAAGEVIERPASVVKELVENAIDAQATAINITLKDAGITEIQVNDNGQGFAPDDLPLAFKRHTTSKIATAQDLFKIRTLGFRGEALASIVAVAKVTVATSDGSVQGGRLVTFQEQTPHITLQAHPQGTTITVQDLFYNTPARLKYLKRPQTELSHTVDLVERLILGHPNIHVVLSNNGRVLIRSSGAPELRAAASRIYGADIAGDLLDFNGSTLDFKVKGLLSLPRTTRANRKALSIILNGRYIRNYALERALLAGYGSKLMVGRFPIVIAQITMDPLLVDVNVHPTKQEVRLSKERDLTQLLTETVATCLGQQNLIPEATQLPVSQHHETHDFELATSLQHTQATPDFSTPSETNRVDDVIAPYTLQPLSLTKSSFQDSVALQKWDDWIKKDQHPAPFHSTVEDGSGAPSVRATAQPEQLKLAAQADTGKLRPFPNLQYITQLRASYLVAESDDGFYLIDQHAAQERINYEHYRVAIGEVSLQQQQLLVPVVLDFGPADFLQLIDHQQELATLGLFFEAFGQTSLIFHSHPTWMPVGQEKTILTQLLTDFLNDPSLSLAKFREQTAILISCKTAIKAHHSLDRRQAEQLLHDLAQTQNPFNCPHGRPVLIHFADRDIERLFKRIQDSHSHLTEF